MKKNCISARSGALLDKKYWEFFFPTILMSMTLTMSLVIDSMIVGNMLGAEALAAVNLTLPVLLLYNSAAVCFGMGGATIIAVAKGKHEDDYASAVFTATCFALLGFSLLLLIVQELNFDELVNLLTREPSLRPLVSSYLHVLVYGTPLTITISGLVYSLRVDDRVKLASCILIVSNLVNLALDLFYMGPLNMGISGSSLATVSGYFVCSFLFIPYALSKKRTLHILSSKRISPRRLLTHIRKMVQTGLPAATGSILISFKLLCINHITLAVAGKSGMVAFSVCLSCLSFVSMFISGAAQAMTPILGVLYGENDDRGVYFVLKKAFIILMLASLSATILLGSFPGTVLKLFGIHHAADIAEGIPAIRIFSLSLIGTSITFLFMYYFMTIGRTKLSMTISCVQGTSVVPIAFVLSRIMGIGGVWAAFLCAEILTIGVMYIVARYLVSSNPKKYKNMLLLDQTRLSHYKRADTTCNCTKQEIRDARDFFSCFMKDTAVEESLCEEVLASLQEAADKIARHAHPENRECRIDMILEMKTDILDFTIRDNGKDIYNEGKGSLGSGKAGVYTLEYFKAIGFHYYRFRYRKTT